MNDDASPRGSCLRLHVRILSIAHATEFRGSALAAGLRPKFVVSLILDGHDKILEDSPSGIRLKTHQVIVFALDSVTRLFGERDIVGQTFDLSVWTYDVRGKPRFHLELA